MARRSIVAIALVSSLLFTGGMYVLASRTIQKDQPVAPRQNAVEQSDRDPVKVLSRGVIELSLQYSRQLVLSPPASARQHAYVASAYSDTLQKGLSQKDALFVAQEVLKRLLPGTDVEAGINSVAAEYIVSQKSPQENANPDAVAIIEQYAKRMAGDRHDLVWDGVVPSGNGKWVGQNPESPRAGDWMRWSVNGVAVIPKPLENGSEAEQAELTKIHQAIDARSPEDTQRIEMWSGKDGTATPDAIWQDKVYETISTSLPEDTKTSDAAYALIQKQLAQVMADAVMECWRVKYTYWTARPATIDTSIKPAIPEPNYPSYPSAHSAVSSAAAQILSAMAPSHKGEWFELAEAASDARAISGVHFPSDVSAGLKLGELIGQQAVTTQKLTSVLD